MGCACAEYHNPRCPWAETLKLSSLWKSNSAHYSGSAALDVMRPTQPIDRPRSDAAQKKQADHRSVIPSRRNFLVDIRQVASSTLLSTFEG
jgi:hypothetical protein